MSNPKIINILAATTAWSAPETAIPKGATRVEVWGMDSIATPTAHEACWARETSQAGKTAPVKIPAGQTFIFDRPKGLGDWTIAVRADAGTTDIVLKVS